MSKPEHPEFADVLIAIYRETVEPLYEYASRRANGSRELAEDVTQEAYMRAASAWQKGGLPDQPLAWLKTTARNLLLNHHRRRAPVNVSGADLDAMTEGHPSNGVDVAGMVCWGLARLRPRHARLLEAFYLDGSPVRQIAENAGVTEKAIEGRLRRARLALRNLLSPHVGDQGEHR